MLILKIKKTDVKFREFKPTEMIKKNSTLVMPWINQQHWTGAVWRLVVQRPVLLARGQIAAPLTPLSHGSRHGKFSWPAGQDAGSGRLDAPRTSVVAARCPTVCRLMVRGEWLERRGHGLQPPWSAVSGKRFVVNGHGPVVRYRSCILVYRWLEAESVVRPC